MPFVEQEAGMSTLSSTFVEACSLVVLAYPPHHPHPPAVACSALNGLHHTIGLARVDLLASLGDLLEHFGVAEGVVGGDLGGLGFEGDFVGLDACAGRLSLVHGERKIRRT